jgi:hypothetical protein
MTITDPLTGLYTRNAFNIFLEKEIIKSINNNLSLVITNIDDFKLWAQWISAFFSIKCPDFRKIVDKIYRVG